MPPVAVRPPHRLARHVLEEEVILAVAEGDSVWVIDPPRVRGEVKNRSQRGERGVRVHHLPAPAVSPSRSGFCPKMKTKSAGIIESTTPASTTDTAPVPRFPCNDTRPSRSE